MSRIASVAFLVFYAWGFGGLSSVKAETETWRIRSFHPYTAQLEFYSQDRKGLVWPGRGQVYALRDSSFHTYSLECNPGERICWGAWDTGSGSPYWGVGRNSRHGCTGCCWTCGRKGEPRGINLR